MRLFSVACRAAEHKMADLFTGELHPRERLELEAHADICTRCDTALRDLAMISVALDRAYAPLRQRATLISPARARLAARAEPRPTTQWWRVGFVGRPVRGDDGPRVRARSSSVAFSIWPVKPGVVPSAPSASVIQRLLPHAAARPRRPRTCAGSAGTRPRPTSARRSDTRWAASPRPSAISNQDAWLSSGAPR